MEHIKKSKFYELPIEKKEPIELKLVLKTQSAQKNIENQVDLEAAPLNECEQNEQDHERELYLAEIINGAKPAV